MEITGKLIQKLGESSGTSEKTGMPWRTAEFLVEIPGSYKRNINFKVRDGQYNLIKRFEDLIGKEVEVLYIQNDFAAIRYETVIAFVAMEDIVEK